MSRGTAKRILIVGGGYIGLYVARGLERQLRANEVEITLVNPESFMTYQPFLPEAASGNIEPRHVVVPLRSALRRTRVLIGWVTALDHEKRTATLQPSDGEPYELYYDIVVLGLGSVARVMPVRGLAENGIGFTTVSEAIYLRNQVLSRMDAAESTSDEGLRRRALTFVFVGGGYAGVEALAELEDLSRDASRRYRSVRREDMRWVLVEAMGSILPEIGSDLGEYALDSLRHRDIEVHLNTRLESAEGGVMRLSDGTTFESDTLVWTAGVRAHPLTSNLGFPVADKGRIVADEYLRVKGVPDAWAAGDVAAVPDLATGGVTPPTAQHALRQARRIARNIAAQIKGGKLEPFRYKQLGALVGMGRYKGVARVLGLRLKGASAWFLHRTYHLLLIPTINRKARVMADWTVALFFKRDVVQLGALQHPKDPFRQALGFQDTRRVQPPHAADQP